MDEHRDEVRFEQVGSKGVSRAVPILTFLIGIFIGAAVVKPWDLVLPPRSASVDQAATSSARSISSPTPATPPAPSPSGPPAECVFAGGWRVFALGQRDALGGDSSTGGGVQPSSPPFGDIGNPLRRWLEVAPLTEVSGPDDPRIPFVTIVSVRITGIGYCPPPGGADEPPPGSRLEVWSIGADGAATALALQRVSLAAPMALEVAVHIPAGEDPTGAGRWAPGRYVFAVASPDGTYGRWFGVEIRTPPGRPAG
jgi:hypothetical protein